MVSGNQTVGVVGDEPQELQNHDSVEHKQRTRTACLQCRSKKRRCDGKTPSCSNCVVSGQSGCQYPGVQKRRGEGKSKQRVKALEDRLLKLEAKLRGGQSAAATPEHANPPEEVDAPEPSGLLENAPGLPNTAQDDMEVTQTAQPLYSRGLSLPHHPLFRQVPDRIAEIRSSNVTGSFRTVVSSPIRPGTAELSLLEHALPEICKEFPFFSIREFLDQMRNQGFASIEACGSASRWACANAAIALSIHVKTVNNSFEKLSHFVWAYFKNAYAVFPELMLHGHGVDTVQALVLMALFTRDSADTRTTSLLLSTVLRIYQTLDPGLYRTDGGPSNSSMATEYARRPIWTAFILDVELSLCCGLSPAIGAGDVDIDLPSGRVSHRDGEEEAIPTDDNTCASIFRQRAELALIHSRVRTRLYSSEALNVPETELLTAVVTLDQSLEDWIRKLPLEGQPGPVEATLEPHCVILHLAFHNLTSMVHWAARRHSTWDPVTKGRLREGSLSVINLSRLKVRAAAQHTLRLLRQSPFEQFAQFWQNLCYPLSASMILLLSILECPEDPEAEADAQLIRVFARQAKQMQSAGDYDLSSLLTACFGLEQLANAAIHEARNHETSIVARAEPLQNHFPHDAISVCSTFKELLSSATHPMYVAQGLLTNLPNRDVEISNSVARLFGIPLAESKPGYGPLVPACMKPGTYGFGFEARG